MEKFESWGRYPKVHHKSTIILSRDPDLSGLHADQLYLPFGQGRSYGDSCLNEEGGLILSHQLNRILAFDHVAGIVECEAGVNYKSLIQHVLPKGWFPAVTPGTQYVTIGGAIANDVHGKNHHSAGCLGRWIQSFRLLRSDGNIIECSAYLNSELFSATIGGLGLTGMILSARLQLIPFGSSDIEVEQIPFHGLEGYFALNEDAEREFEFVVSWVDALSKRGQEKGVLLRANAPERNEISPEILSKSALMGLPFNLPGAAMNRFTIGLFNKVYAARFGSKLTSRTQDYRSYFYPLDAISNWNRAYGKRGLLQFQLVIPKKQAIEKLREIFAICDRAGETSFLTVLKNFGKMSSPGMMSFPREGVTLNLDFPNKGLSTLKLLTKLDDLVLEAGGAVYPAKDATMSAGSFRSYFPRWEEYSTYIDPKFSSSFWRRMGG